MHNKPFKRWPLLWITLLTLGLAACGFQPRGQAPALPAALSPLAISGVDVDHPLYLTLQRRLAAQGSKLVSDPAQAGAVLVLSNLVSRRELISVDRRNKAIEYELIEALTYQVRQGGHESEPQRMTASRILYNPGTSLLARSREEDELRQQLREDLADSLLQRLAAWH